VYPAELLPALAALSPELASRVESLRRRLAEILPRRFEQTSKTAVAPVMNMTDDKDNRDPARFRDKIVHSDSTMDDHHRVISPPPAPFSTEDLFAALRLNYPEDEASELARDLSEDIGSAGVIWSADILLWVALLSPEHEEKIRAYVGWSAERMAVELERVRREL
jgi:hypothetical protein